jgi:hypothetical protein
VEEKALVTLTMSESGARTFSGWKKNSRRKTETLPICFLPHEIYAAFHSWSERRIHAAAKSSGLYQEFISHPG